MTLIQQLLDMYPYPGNSYSPANEHKHEHATIFFGDGEHQNVFVVCQMHRGLTCPRYYLNDWTSRLEGELETEEPLMVLAFVMQAAERYGRQPTEVTQ